MRFPSSFWWILICTATIFSVVPLSCVGNNETDRLALLEIKARMINDPLGILSSWNESRHFCEWHGVTCGYGRTRVIALNLNSSKLTGTLSPFIGNLTFLRVLNLDNNIITGVIPSEIGYLDKLQYLQLSNNSLGRMISLNITANKNKHPGTAPHSIFNLSSLVKLDLGQNQLVGSLPVDLGTIMPNLQLFSVGTNLFTGSIPPSISNCSNLALLQLNNNNFRGQIPSLHKLHGLQKLLLGSNFLGLGQANDVNFVSSLGNASMLEWFDISHNNFGGGFPSTICNLSRLSVLGLQENSITGQIPTCIQNLASLQQFNAKLNQLSGPIPSGIGKLKRVIYLNLANNKLSGHIPPSIGNLTHLVNLFLSMNNLVGQIPSSLGNCSSLLELYLSQNNLNGHIPPQVFSLPSLPFGLDLSYNPLTGTLPVEVGKLRNLEYLDVSNAMLSGPIPTSLGDCIALDYLHMEGNLFHGSIPPTLSALRVLHNLDLSRNNLSGEIPVFLAQLSLQTLDLSYNSFEGEVPVGGVFRDKTRLSVFGNSGLCGGLPELKLPPCNTTKAQKEGILHQQWRLMIGVPLGVALLVVSTLFYAFYYRKKRKEPKTKSEICPLPTLSYQSLLKATNGFSSENFLGRGASGVVYKGNLEDHTVVAVKVFNPEHKSSVSSFNRECRVLRNVRHRNLVKVITACSSIDHQGNDFKALVYEYMANGSLEDWLHQKPINGTDQSVDGHIKINLLKRIDIAMNVASALEYLHHHSGAPIVHCDLKPSNILFDNEMVAHVGDFGLAKFILNRTSRSYTNRSSFLGVRGSIGYTPPEYGLGNGLSTYGDVYSFGILLLELFTGKRPTDNMFQQGVTIHDFVKAALPNHTMEILDQALVEDIVEEDMSSRDDLYILRISDNDQVISEALTSVLKIGVECSSELPQERSDMTHIVAQLSLIKNKFNGILSTRHRRRNPVAAQG